MRAPSLVLFASLALGVSLWFGMRPATGAPSASTAIAPPSVARRAASACRADRFVPNLGQWDPRVRYAVLGSGVAWLHDDGFTVRFSRRADGSSEDARTVVGGVVRTRFPGRAENVRAEQRLGGVHNFLVGRDRSSWRSSVPGFGRVVLERVRPGIDVVFRDPGRGVFEYDLELGPGADLDAFVVRCEGADSLRLAADGSLCLSVPTPDGSVELRQPPPIAWQETTEGRRPIEVGFRLVGDDGYGFFAPERDPDLATVVDPGVAWSTYLGGGASDSISDLAFEPGVGVWVAGWAGSLDFPVTVGAYQTTGERDGFVARLDVGGSALQYATYFGGSEGDEVKGIALGPGLSPTIVGRTTSADLPTTAQAFQPVYGGASPIVPIGDAFVARLSVNGDALLSSTYLGGIADEVAEAVVVDAQGHAHVCGWTSSPDFPTTPGVVQPTLGGPFTLQTDGFVASIAPDGSADWNTYIGGGLNDQLLDIALVDATGDLVVAGWSTSVGYPTTPFAYRTTKTGAIDIVVSRLVPSGSSFVWSSFLGGVSDDAASAVALAPDESVWVAGWTTSTNYPLGAGAVQTALSGERDVAISHLSADGQSLGYSTYFGGPDSDQARAIAVDGSEIVVAGEAGAAFPLTANATQPAFGGGVLDGFLLWLTNGGATLSYSSYFGGSGQTDAFSSVSFATGLVVAGGNSFAADFPVTAPALQPQLLGVEDGVVVMLDLLTDLGGGLEVSSELAPSARPIAAGEHELLAARASNRSPRSLSIDAIRLLFAGAGFTPAQVRHVEIWRDDPGVGTERDSLLAELTGPVADDSEIDVPLVGAVVPAGEDVILRVVAELAADASLGTVEVACATTAPDAWTLSAFGAGAGPSVSVLGDGVTRGPALIAGALPGDGDGDGALTVLDLRWMCRRFGTPDVHVDADGDLVLTPADIDLVRSAVLGRPTAVDVPAVLTAGSWFTVRGVFPTTGTVDATLGGRSLRSGCLTPRELTLFVDPVQVAGSQDLTIYVDGALLFASPVLVQ